MLLLLFLQVLLFLVAVSQLLVGRLWVWQRGHSWLRRLCRRR